MGFLESSGCLSYIWDARFLKVNLLRVISDRMFKTLDIFFPPRSEFKCFLLPRDKKQHVTKEQP
jgi:hypothetical protein